MISLGQLTYLPESFATNPFYRLLVRFARYKFLSFESLFTAESILLRYAWVGLIVMFALVLPPLETIDYLWPLGRLSTLVYPLFFIWSITRLTGVELLQIVLEGHWTPEVLSAPLSNREFNLGLITPLWITVRQYFLITFFSLALYGLETSVIAFDENHKPILDDVIQRTWFYEVLFFNAISWVVFVYMARMFAEVRLRNGLLKGLATVVLLIAGLLLFAGYWVLLFHYPQHMFDPAVLWSFTGLTLFLVLLSGLLYFNLSHRFRDYLQGQFGIDRMIFDDTDLHATAWHQLDRPTLVPAPPGALPPSP